MDNAVALVQAFLRLHGYLTVTEFPVVRRNRAGGYDSVTDLDILASRFGEAVEACHAADLPESMRHSDHLLGIAPGVPDMIVGEVKEGRAELNAAATRAEVLVAALARFGCCRERDLEGIVRDLLRHGHAQTRHGHKVRLVAFGALPPAQRDRRCHVILLRDVVAHICAYIQTHWSLLQASACKDPGLGFLMTLEKAQRNM